MRPSQKNNRPRNKGGRKSAGASVNRVYDSSGPEGKVRGTPQQIIEKYQTLARDKSTAGDRVMAENFLQHAEHYVRILTAAQAAAAPIRREDAREDAREPEAREEFELEGETSENTADGMMVMGDDEDGPDMLTSSEQPRRRAANRSRENGRDAGHEGENGEERRRRRPARRRSETEDAETEEAAPRRRRARSAPSEVEASGEDMNGRAASDEGDAAPASAEDRGGANDWDGDEGDVAQATG